MKFVHYLFNNGSYQRVSGFDLDGNPVKRTKEEYPYSYDGFVQEMRGDKSEITGSVYSDRLSQWDHELNSKLVKKHFKDTGIDNGGDYWDGRPFEAIEGFLRERLDRPNLRLIVVMEYCNVATGYPLWFFGYADK